MAGRADRISLVLWANGPDDLSPVFEPDGSGVRTLVAVWPTDPFGTPLRDQLEDVRVLWWSLSPTWFASLRARHRAWHLGQHDVLVTSTETVPCFDSLMARARAAGHPLAHRIASVVSQMS